MTSSPHSGSDRQLARDKGLGRLSAVTLGATAASLVGAVGIAVTLHNSTATTNTDTTTVAPSAPTNPNNDNLGADESGPDGSSPSDSSPDGSTSQLQPAAPPSNSDNPPDATSGGS